MLPMHVIHYNGVYVKANINSWADPGVEETHKAAYQKANRENESPLC